MYKKSWYVTKSLEFITSAHALLRRHISAHSALAGLVLATELLHGGGEPTTKSFLRGEVLEVISLLSSSHAASFSLNVMAQRGVATLRRMIAIPAPPPPPTVTTPDPIIPPTMAEDAIPSLEELWPGMDLSMFDGGSSQWGAAAVVEDGMWPFDEATAGVSATGWFDQAGFGLG